MSSCTDYVRLFLDLERPELSAGRRPTFELCGNRSSIAGPRTRLEDRPVYSSGRSVVFEFHSGHVRRNHTGFIGRYRFIDTGSPAVPRRVCPGEVLFVSLLMIAERRGARKKIRRRKNKLLLLAKACCADIEGDR